MTYVKGMEKEKRYLKRLYECMEFFFYFCGQFEILTCWQIIYATSQVISDETICLLF